MAFITAIGLGAYSAYGQAVDSTRSWSEGPLRWEEFQGDGSFQEMNALSVISWQEQTQKERVGYIRYYYPVIHAVFHPIYSFVKEGCNTPAELQRQQNLFNLNEYFARAFRDSLVHGVSNVAETRSLFNRRCTDAFEKNDSAFLSKLDTDLSEDSFTPSTFTWASGNGFLFEMGYSYRYLPVAPERFNHNANGLDFRFGYIFDNLSVVFDWSPHLPSVRKRAITTFDAQVLSFGYTFLRKERFSLTACLGGGIGDYHMIREDDPIELFTKDLESGFIHESLQAEYTIASFIMVNKGSPERNDLRLFVRLGSDQLILSDGIVPSLALNFGLNFTTNHLRIVDGRKAADR